jgi:hypothetical protein
MVVVIQVCGYVDSNFVGDLDKRRSTSGYVFTLAGGPICWMSKLQNTIASHACKEAIWLKGLLGEFGKVQDKVNVLCDSQSAIHLANNPTYHSKTKHIVVKYHFVRHVIDGGGVALKKVHTQENCARHVYKTSTVREVAVVFGFSWLAEKVMNGLGQGIR